MNDFVVYTPTRILFGASQIDAFTAAIAQFGKKAMIVIGGGSMKRLGYLATVSEACKKAGIAVEVFEGIEPNPQSATINRAAKEATQKGVQFFIALGGGSVMDATKAISALVHDKQDDVWPYVLGEPKNNQFTGALPIVTIPTTAATASEVTPYAVISNKAVNGKSVLAYDFFKPAVSWLNPDFTVDLSPTTTQDGAADILSHVFENYLLGGDESPIADGYTEVVMETVLDHLPLLMRHPKNVAYRGRLLWASTLALNGIQLAGRKPAEFVLHSMEHALSGFYPQLAHGRGLATLFPAYFKWLLSKGRAQARLARLARRLFDVTHCNDELTALSFIEMFSEWLNDNDLYQSLPDLGIEPAKYRAIAEYAVKVYGTNGHLNALGSMRVDDIVEVFELTHAQGS